MTEKKFEEKAEKINTQEITCTEQSDKNKKDSNESLAEAIKKYEDSMQLLIG